MLDQWSTQKSSSAFWPRVDTRDSASDACRNAAVAAFVVAVFTVFTLLFRVLMSTGLDLWGLFDAGLFALLGWGLLRCSRVAAVATLLLYLAERVLVVAQAGVGATIIVALLIIVALVGGVRGAFAYQRHVEAKPVAAPQL
jgi:hypothetical protein